MAAQKIQVVTWQKVPFTHEELPRTVLDTQCSLRSVLEAEIYFYLKRVTHYSQASFIIYKIESYCKYHSHTETGFSALHQLT